MKTLQIILCGVLWLGAINVHSQTRQDTLDIISVASDYVEAWYDGDGARMRSSLHPMLSKMDKNGTPLSLDRLVELTNDCLGCNPAQRVLNIEILDIFNVFTPESDATFTYAVVKCESYSYIDYFHISNAYGTWQIANVLWDYKTSSLSGTEEQLEQSLNDYHTALRAGDMESLEELVVPGFSSGKTMCYELIERIDIAWLTEHIANYTEGFASSESVAIEVQDIHNGNIALAKVTSGDKIELIQLSYLDDTWKLVNVFRNYYTGLRDFTYSTTVVPNVAPGGFRVASFNSRLNYNPDITYSLTEENSNTIHNEYFTMNGAELLLNTNASEIATRPITVLVRAVSVFGDALEQSITLEFEAVSGTADKVSSTTKELKIFPNPVNETIRVVTNSSNNSTLKIFDQELKQVPAKENYADRELVDVSHITPGQYYVVLSDKEQDYSAILVKL